MSKDACEGGDGNGVGGKCRERIKFEVKVEIKM